MQTPQSSQIPRPQVPFLPLMVRSRETLLVPPVCPPLAVTAAMMILPVPRDVGSTGRVMRVVEGLSLFLICQSRPLYIQAGKQNAMGRRCRRIYAPTVPKAASTVHTCKSKISIVILVSHNYTGRSLSLEGHLKR